MNKGYQAAYKLEASGMAVKYSPFDANTLAFAAADNFGIVGKGKLLILTLTPERMLTIKSVIEEKDAIFDCAWSETNETLVLTGSGDGSIKLWDIVSKQLLFSMQSHKNEVFSVECNHKQPNVFLSSGNDGFVKVWDLNAKSLVMNVPAHRGSVYQASWHPVNEKLLASVGGDGLLRLWDLNSGGKTDVASIRAHDQEILSTDFNKYMEQIATASIDKTIRLWDLRNFKVPMNILPGHRYPVRKVKFSPHMGNIIASGSYDMMVHIWDTNDLAEPLKFKHGSHSEFVIGLDFSLFNEGQIASTSWDGRLLVWNWNEPQPQI